MYNGCRRENTLQVAAMQGLHFEKFLKDFNENIDDSVEVELEIWLKKNKPNCSERANSLVKQYGNYGNCSQKDHGQ